MPAQNPETRSLIARIAAGERWGRSGSRADRRQQTAAATAGLRAKFLREADPDGRLSPAEREARADQLMRAHMLRLAHRSAEARRKAGHHTAAAESAEAELSALTDDAGDRR